MPRLLFGASLALTAAAFRESVAPFYSSWVFAVFGLASGITALVFAGLRARWLLAGICVVVALAAAFLTMFHWAIWGMGQTGWH